MKKVERFMLVILAAVTLSAISGCNSAPKSSVAKVNPALSVTLINNVFTVDYIPHSRYYVGGGFDVYYEAPVEGMIYWVDLTNKRILVSEHLDEGEAFEEDIPLDSDESTKVLFNNMTEVSLGLYFVPMSHIYAGEK